MSTPLSVDSPPTRHHLRTDSEQKRDLQEKIQHMITLQYHSTSEIENVDDLHGENLFEYSASSTDGLVSKTTTEVTRANAAVGNKVGQQITNATALWPRESQAPVDDGLPPPSPHSGIGRGTLVFPSTFDHRRRVSSSDGSVPSHLAMPAAEKTQAPSQNPQTSLRPSHFYAGYGTLGSTSSNAHGDLQLLQQGGSLVDLQHQHEFSYGHPDLPNQEDHDQKDERCRPENATCAKICCLYAPLVRLLMQDNVHRSFCFASIDGMLTGSGIASAFCALQVLSITSSWEVRVAVVIFTMAACIGDAVCMAMGHVWTSYVMSSGHAQERGRERQLLDADKGNAKARLVDMLLSRGMLKIDAMSLADTLEGYPDMFVSALVGDSLLAGTEIPEDETGDSHEQHLPTADGVDRRNDGSFGGLSWKFPSYGQFNEMDHDPQSFAMTAVWKESQLEGFFMIFGFSLFSLIPSLLWLLLPELVAPATTRMVIESSLSDVPKTNDQVVSVQSLVVSICCFFMWFLGVWKSHYLESNWIMSGIEHIVVLVACVLAAYGIGFGLYYLIGGEDGVTLTNVVRRHS